MYADLTASLPVITVVYAGVKNGDFALLRCRDRSALLLRVNAAAGMRIVRQNRQVQHEKSLKPVPIASLSSPAPAALLRWLDRCGGSDSRFISRAKSAVQRSARLLGWLLLAALIFATVCPISLRPTSNEPLWLERSLPYLVVSALLSIGYPRQRIRVIVLTVAAAGMLEVAQLLQPSRHARLPDFLIKAAGCSLGWAGAQIALRWSRARQW